MNNTQARFSVIVSGLTAYIMGGVFVIVGFENQWPVLTTVGLLLFGTGWWTGIKLEKYLEVE